MSVDSLYESENSNSNSSSMSRENAESLSLENSSSKFIISLKFINNTSAYRIINSNGLFFFVN